MNSPGKISSPGGHVLSASDGDPLKKMDATLRLIATLPAPTGLEDRVFAAAIRAPRSGRLLQWPKPLYARDWVRSIAAAAIVLAVGGGGWGIYSHVEQNVPGQATVAPRRIFEQGGFSSADVIRRPQTLNGPVVKKAEPVAAVKPAADAKKPARGLQKHRNTELQKKSQIFSR
jgi:hypothetical protein